MELHRLYRTQDLSAPLEAVFPFFALPENLSRITPPSMNFRLLTPSPRVMRQGALFDYLVKISGFTLRWTSQITEYDPPRRFVDVQLKGPYSFWHHAHTFEALESGTRIVDEVNYLLPFGPLGRLAHRLMVRRQLEEIFRYRERTVERFFDSPREST